MASVRKRTGAKGSSWQVRWYGVDGRLKSRTFKTQREAKAYRAKLESTGVAGRPRGAGDRITLAEALESWQEVNASRWRDKTKVVNRSATRHLTTIANARIDRLTPEIVQDAVASLSPHVQRQSVNAVKGALKHVKALGYEVVPGTLVMHSPRPNDTGQRALSIEEVEALAEKIGQPHSDVVRLLAYTGVRVGELAGLEVRDYDPVRGRLAIVRAVSWAHGRAVVGSPKTEAGRRVVPVTEPVRTILERRIRDRPAEERHPYAPIVVGPRGGARWNPSNWRRDAGWSDALETCGLGRVRLHDLRHTYASLVRRSGADIYVLQKVLGHRQIATTIDRYGHLYDDEIDDLGDALGRALKASHGQNVAKN